MRLSWSDGFSEYASHNVLATQRLLEAARDAEVRRFVYASSSSVYGNQDRYPTVETDLPRPYSPYGVTKLAAEHLCGLYAENWGLSTVSLRYFTVFGPRQRPDMSIHRLCEAVGTGASFPRFGDGTQVREFTYVADIVAANLAAADADVAPGTVVNIAGGGEITLNGLIAMVGELAGYRRRHRGPPRAGRRRETQRCGDRTGAATARVEPAGEPARWHRRAARVARRSSRHGGLTNHGFRLGRSETGLLQCPSLLESASPHRLVAEDAALSRR